VGRHPHVFGDVKAETSAEVLRNWEALKAEEKKSRENKNKTESAGRAGQPEDHASLLAGVSSGLPALLEAYKLSSRAARVGFDWPDIHGLFEKLEEEAEELKKDLKEFPAPGPRPQGRGIAGSGSTQISEALRQRLEDEIGDLFFVVVNLARYLSVDSELALKKTNRKFRRRFQYVEEQLRAQGRKLEEASLQEMESLWQKSKPQGQPE
jgi:uncharacterized protein YabN with tetrapyrrole methylase and pyrophosphatase domain